MVIQTGFLLTGSLSLADLVSTLVARTRRAIWCPFAVSSLCLVYGSGWPRTSVGAFLHFILRCQCLTLQSWTAMDGQMSCESPSHGENRGSSPLGSASDIKILAAS